MAHILTHSIKLCFHKQTKYSTFSQNITDLGQSTHSDHGVYHLPYHKQFIFTHFIKKKYLIKGVRNNALQLSNNSTDRPIAQDKREYRIIFFLFLHENKHYGYSLAAPPYFFMKQFIVGTH